jgi:hypothetical protein
MVKTYNIHESNNEHKPTIDAEYSGIMGKPMITNSVDISRYINNPSKHTQSLNHFFSRLNLWFQGRLTINLTHPFLFGTFEEGIDLLSHGVGPKLVT